MECHLLIQKSKVYFPNLFFKSRGKKQCFFLTRNQHAIGENQN